MVTIGAPGPARTRAAVILIHSTIAGAIFWIAVACCAAAQIAIVRAMVRSPQRRDEPGSQAPVRGRGLELAWALIPAVMLGLVLVLTWHAVRSASAPAGTEATAPRLISER